MVLDISGGLFGKNNPLTDEEGRVYTLMRPQIHKRIVSPGWAVIGSATFTAGGAQNYKRVMGFETSVHMMNQSGATRNSTIVIENLSLGTTLVNGNVDITDGGFFNTAFSWSLEDIRPGDSIKFTVGNEGVGTHTVQGTKYWSVPGIAFHRSVVASNYERHPDGYINSETINSRFSTGVYLPDGAVVTSCIIYGNNTKAWELKRENHTGTTAEVMAAANINSVDTSISNPTVDNFNYRYWLDTINDIDVDEKIYGARIGYTNTIKGSSTQGYYEFQLSGFFKSVGETSDD